MPNQEVLEKFINAVENQPHYSVIEAFYADDATIQENQNDPKVGKENLIKNEREMLNKAKTVNSKCVRPFFQKDNIVIIRWKFRFEWKDNTITEIEELVYQEWEKDKIKREQFFFMTQSSLFQKRKRMNNLIELSWRKLATTKNCV